MMQVSSRKRKIVWAVDPFCETQCLLTKRTARAVGVLASQWDAEIEPVYILAEIEPKLRMLPALLRDIQRDAQSELRQMIRGLSLPRLAPIQIIVSPRPELHERVDLLVEHSKKNRADVIAVGTRAHKGLSRALLGSFAETLILRSEVPLYVVNPREKAFRRIRHILFPTDFSEHSKAAFGQVVEFAKEIKASVTLLHRIKYDWTPIVQATVVAYPAYREAFEQEVSAKQRMANVWVESARNFNVKADCIVDCRSSGSIADTVLQKSHKRTDLIAMAAHSGAVASTLLGSVTRQVVRRAGCPVWVIHAEARKYEEMAPSVARIY